MTLRGTVQVNSEDIGAIAVLQNRLCSCYTFLRKTTTTKNYFGTGHEKQEFTSFYDTEQT